MARKPRTPKDDRNAAAVIFYTIGGIILLWSVMTAWSFRDGFRPGERSTGTEAFRRAVRKAVPGVVIGVIFLGAGYNLKRKA